VDVQLGFGFECRLILARVDAIHRANIHASSVFGADARFGNYVSHSGSPLFGQRAGGSSGEFAHRQKFLISRAAGGSKQHSAIVRGGNDFLNQQGCG
jgi:hypothetical protein